MSFVLIPEPKLETQLHLDCMGGHCLWNLMGTKQRTGAPSTFFFCALLRILSCVRVCALYLSFELRGELGDGCKQRSLHNNPHWSVSVHILFCGLCVADAQLFYFVYICFAPLSCDVGFFKAMKDCSETLFPSSEWGQFAYMYFAFSIMLRKNRELML